MALAQEAQSPWLFLNPARSLWQASVQQQCCSSVAASKLKLTYFQEAALSGGFLFVPRRAPGAQQYSPTQALLKGHASSSPPKSSLSPVPDAETLLTRIFLASIVLSRTPKESHYNERGVRHMKRKVLSCMTAFGASICISTPQSLLATVSVTLPRPIL